jgi:hypothetical protein
MKNHLISKRLGAIAAFAFIVSSFIVMSGKSAIAQTGSEEKVANSDSGLTPCGDSIPTEPGGSLPWYYGLDSNQCCPGGLSSGDVEAYITDGWVEHTSTQEGSCKTVFKDSTGTLAWYSGVLPVGTKYLMKTGKQPVLEDCGNDTDQTILETVGG